MNEYRVQLITALVSVVDTINYLEIISGCSRKEVSSTDCLEEIDKPLLTENRHSLGNLYTLWPNMCPEK